MVPFMRRGSLGVRELEARDGDQDLGDGEGDVGTQLPEHRELLPLVQPLLDEGGHHEGEPGQEHADGHPPQGRQRKADPGRPRVDQPGHDRDQDHHQGRVDELQLGRLELERPDVQVHAPGLQHPGRGLLIEERPEEGNEGEDLQHPQHRPRPLDRHARVGHQGAVEPVAALRAAPSSRRLRRAVQTTRTKLSGLGPVGGSS